ncbi:hypothetical protein [Mycobacterium sp. SMC-4]|uniref:hypothetical protein n=1 Tax=Mycobacterium sp. SMC-4 TaxID=2857059 RepID=UPI003D0232A9
MDSGAVPDPVAPPTPELLADLQAGLLDDVTAAHVRRMVRADPHAAHTLAGLDAARRAVADLAADEAPDVPAEVVARVAAALRRAGKEQNP